MPDTESPATFDVFISYSRRDKLFAQKLQKALQAEASPPARGDE